MDNINLGIYTSTVIEERSIELIIQLRKNNKEKILNDGKMFTKYLKIFKTIRSGNSNRY